MNKCGKFWNIFGSFLYNPLHKIKGDCTGMRGCVREMMPMTYVVNVSNECFLCQIL